MKISSFVRSIIPAAAVLFVLSGCGGDMDPVMQSPQATIAATTVRLATMPVADCEVEGCRGLRIIDANAEAWRYKALMRESSTTLE